MIKKKITDIFQEKVSTRKERNERGEWETVEKTYHEKRQVDSLLLGLRFVHYFVDIGVITLIQIPFVLFSFVSHSIILRFLPVLIFLGYYILFEFYFQRTIGKYFTGSLVINEYGEKPDFKTICLRTLARIIPFDPFSTFWTDDNRFWHDTLTKTFVVSKDELSLIKRIQAGEKPKKSDEGKWDEWRKWQQ